MKRRNHVLLLACACAFIGAEQLIMGALKGTKARNEAATPARRPTLNERLTVLEGKFDALETRINTLEGQKTTPVENIVSETELLETTTPQVDAESSMSALDAVTTETPATEEMVASEMETNTPIIPLEELASSLGMQVQAPMQSEESLMLDKILAEQQ